MLEKPFQPTHYFLMDIKMKNLFIILTQYANKIVSFRHMI